MYINDKWQTPGTGHLPAIPSKTQTGLHADLTFNATTTRWTTKAIVTRHRATSRINYLKFTVHKGRIVQFILLNILRWHLSCIPSFYWIINLLSYLVGLSLIMWHSVIYYKICVALSISETFKTPVTYHTLILRRVVSLYHWQLSITTFNRRNLWYGFNIITSSLLLSSIKSSEISRELTINLFQEVVRGRRARLSGRFCDTTFSVFHTSVASTSP